MNKNTFYVIGVMSGTSLDGIDIAYIEFKTNNSCSFKIIHAETVLYTNEWKSKLSNAIALNDEALCKLDTSYTEFLADTISGFIDKYKITNLDMICSHGHTVHHRPESNYTFQIGNKETLATMLKKTVICDFRVQDVALGGQGAPLVPIGDRLLFSDYDYCINLGGFANVSTEINNQRIAYDICPVNIVLNHYVERLGFSYDDKGAIALKGKVVSALLNDLNNLDFYNANPPKSLGIEWVNEKIFPVIDNYNISIEDILCTFVEHVAIQISKQLKLSNSKALITGGGAYNDFLMSRLRANNNSEIIIPDKLLIEFKEALIFGLLGVLKFKNEINVLASVTGASKDHSSGMVYSYDNKI